MTHPARAIPYDSLLAGLAAAKDQGLVNVQAQGDLRLYTYTQGCVYDRAWTPITESARGLILDVKNEAVVATPFPKFFNVGEQRSTLIPDLPFETYEKVDGSLIILFWHDGDWYTATKGSFTSEQAQAARRLITNTTGLVPGTTYLFEYVGPQNRIVVRYEREELVLLGGYAADGRELNIVDWMSVMYVLGCRCAARKFYDSISDLIATAGTLPADSEGFVVRFSNGYRLKIKGAEYCRLHRLISNVTPLAIWDSMVAGADLENTRRELPEEFLADYDAIVHNLRSRVANLMGAANDAANDNVHRTDKELGLLLHTIPDPVRGLVFPLRKHGEDKARSLAMRIARPTGNRLDGYKPGEAFKRLEAA